MNSASNRTMRQILLSGIAAVAVFAWLCAPAAAQTASVPAPAPAPLAQATAGVPESPESYVGEGSEPLGPLSPEEVIRMLQEGNAGRPLTIAELAAINDAMKRMEYTAEVRRKMNEGGGGIATSMTGNSSGSMNSTSTGTQPVAAMMNAMPIILRISGSSGQYQALASVNGQQTVLRVGDQVGSSRVSSISLAGVRLTNDMGAVTNLPFASVGGAGMISSGR